MSNEAKAYKWAELPTDHPMEKISRRRVVGEKAMLAEVHLERGCFVPTHAHENEQFAFIMRGAVRFGLDPGSRRSS